MGLISVTLTVLLIMVDEDEAEGDDKDDDLKKKNAINFQQAINNSYWFEIFFKSHIYLILFFLYNNN
jgi:hypothetical protein